MRAYRLARRMSQSALAEKVGVTFQQIQKYERGTNRIGSSRLKKLSTVLGVGIAALFGEEESDQAVDDLLTGSCGEPYAARLLKAFGAITEVKLRGLLVETCRTLGGTQQIIPGTNSDAGR